MTTVNLMLDSERKITVKDGDNVVVIKSKGVTAVSEETAAKLEKMYGGEIRRIEVKAEKATAKKAEAK